MSAVVRPLAAALMGALIVVVAGCKSEAVVAPVPRPAIVERASVAHSPITDTYAGETRARYESALGFRIPGKIDSRLVEVGARVKKGDVLATLEPQDAALEVTSSNAGVAAAQAELSLADAELERHAAMLEKKYISQALYDARVNAQKAAQARLAQARAQLAQAQNNRGYASLRADADGIITSLSAEVGQVVAAGQPIAQLAHDGDIEVLINVPETRIDTFKPGLPVLVEVWANDNKRYPGSIRQISPEADPRTRTFDLRVTIPGTHEDLQLGLTARIYLDAGDAPKAALVPLAALHEKDGKPALWLVDTKTRKVRLQPVEVGAYREEGVTVLSELPADAWVVVAGVHKLVEGQAIKPVDRANRAVALN